MIKGIIKLVKKAKAEHLIWFGIYLLIYLIYFHIIEIVPRSHYMIIATPLDRVIPFCEVFIIPYLSWFFYILIGVLAVYYLDRREYDILATELMMGMTIFLLISTFFPNRQPMRLLEMPRTNIFTMMVAALWKVDTPTNVWPSIHVFNSLAIELSLLRIKDARLQKKSVRLGGIVWCILICMSTVLIKQHSILDIVTGMMLMVLCYLFVNVGGYVLTFEKWDEAAKEIEDRILYGVPKMKKHRKKYPLKDLTEI